MKPLAALSAGDVAALEGVCFDLDDTVLTDGVLTREAYDAVCDLADAGLSAIVVTGRPASWGEVLARQWPIRAAVTENGAIAFCREGKSLRRIDPVSEDERRRRRIRLAGLVENVRAGCPEARLTDDVGGRISDVTWDIGERANLSEESVARIAGEIARAGARMMRSSIHVHATFDTDDKASGVVRLLREHFGGDATRVLVRHAFVGDSGNDAACFAAFSLTLGVANVRRSLSRLSIPPRFVSESEKGAGFRQIASRILALRAHS